MILRGQIGLFARAPDTLKLTIVACRRCLRTMDR